MMNVNVELEHGRKETVEEFLARGKKIEKSEKVLILHIINLLGGLMRRKEFPTFTYIISNMGWSVKTFLGYFGGYLERVTGIEPAL